MDPLFSDNNIFQQDSAVPLGIDTHGGEDVPVHALGPMSYLLSGTYEQNYIHHALLYAACLGDYKEHCSDGRNNNTES